MQLKPKLEFEDKDLELYMAFKSVIEQGDFKIKGNAVMGAASLFAWYLGIEGKIRGTLDNKKKDGAPKIKDGAAKKSDSKG